MSDTPTPLHDAAFMQAFLDVTIPPSDDGAMPGAGSLGLTDGVAGALEADRALGPMVSAGLQAIYDAALARDPSGFAALTPNVRTEIVEAGAAAHPMLMIGVMVHLYQAYYQHPKVLEALGEPPRPPFPEGYALEPTDPQLLEALRTRARLDAQSTQRGSSVGADLG